MGSDSHLGAVSRVHSLTKLSSPFADWALPAWRMSHTETLSVDHLQGRRVCEAQKHPVTALKPDSARLSVN